MKFLYISFFALLYFNICDSQQVKRTVCYYNSWAHTYSGYAKFLPSDIDPSLCTHLVYAYVGIDSNGNVQLIDTNFDNYAIPLISAFADKNPKLVTMLAVDGRSFKQNFANMLTDPAKQKVFVQSILAALQHYKIHGVDLMWEGSTPQQKTGLNNLLSALRSAAKSLSRFVLSLSVGASQQAIERSYDVVLLRSQADFLNVLTVDYHTVNDGVTGANSPLGPQLNDPPTTTKTIKASIKAWISSGAPAAKLNVAIGTYGHTFTLKNTSNIGTGAPITGPGTPGPYTKDKNTWNYIEICTEQSNYPTDWKIFDYNNSFEYGVRDRLWISYDDDYTIKFKGNFIKENGLGGAMIYYLGGDDFKGNCDEEYSLTNAVIAGMGN